MDWNDVNDILWDGTAEEIAAVRCPDCGGIIKYEYFPQTRNTTIGCKGCRLISRGHGSHYVPNFAKIGRSWFACMWMEFLWHKAAYTHARRIRKNNNHKRR